MIKSPTALGDFFYEKGELMHERSANILGQDRYLLTRKKVEQGIPQLLSEKGKRLIDIITDTAVRVERKRDIRNFTFEVPGFPENILMNDGALTKVAEDENGERTGKIFYSPKFAYTVSSSYLGGVPFTMEDKSVTSDLHDIEWMMRRITAHELYHVFQIRKFPRQTDHHIQKQRKFGMSIATTTVTRSEIAAELAAFQDLQEIPAETPEDVQSKNKMLRLIARRIELIKNIRKDGDQILIPGKEQKVA